MRSYELKDDSDIRSMRDLIEALPTASTIQDFEETMMLSSVRTRTRLWEENGKVIGFAFVDDYNNLRFEISSGRRNVQLENEIIAWGVECIQKRNAETGERNTLDASFQLENHWQIEMLKRHGFEQESIRSLHYERDLKKPISACPFPDGYRLRSVNGEHEVENLVTLHRAAFGTANMTLEARLAIMQAPQYEPELDYVVVAPNGELAAFCICGFEDEQNQIGYTDPIGTHPRYQKQGIGKAMVAAGLKALKERSAHTVGVGTSSENIPMQRLAESLGFEIVSESMWFSKIVT